MQSEFKHIIDRHNGILYKIGQAYTNTNEDFKDLYQEILVQLWQSFSSFKGNSKLSTWIYRVALNTAMTFNKKQRRNPTTKSIDEEIYRLAEEISDADNQEAERRKNTRLLYLCINQLSKDDRAVILLYLDDNSYDEIAEILGISSNNVGVKIYRIKKRLFKCLKSQGYGGI